ncbi:hypothetical protein [Pseudonocardia phyllosphaerae]|uniref:hypothetical protein n=1 Tax=Pseudonocardia phyllosphaerae TaxID=3390502 RepID=UPI0039799B87
MKQPDQMDPMQRMWTYVGIGAVIGLVVGVVVALVLGTMTAAPILVLAGIAGGVAAHYLTAGKPARPEQPGPDPADPTPRG